MIEERDVTTANCETDQVKNEKDSVHSVSTAQTPILDNRGEFSKEVQKQNENNAKL